MHSVIPPVKRSYAGKEQTARLGERALHDKLAWLSLALRILTPPSTGNPISHSQHFCFTHTPHRVSDALQCDRSQKTPRVKLYPFPISSPHKPNRETRKPRHTHPASLYNASLIIIVIITRTQVSFCFETTKTRNIPSPTPTPNSDTS
jgi:hypothetical protein